MMKKTLIPVAKQQNDSLEKIDQFQGSINCNNWDYPTDTKVDFTIHHGGQSIYLNYDVAESYTKALYSQINEPVWEDSCVEFFISFDGKYYYNFEFNCIGNVLGGYGNGRRDRKMISPKILQSINTFPSLGRSPIDLGATHSKWSLEIVIPLEAFAFDRIESFNQLNAYMNLYKCGDKLQKPHFLSWQPISVATPDFHLPAFFGYITFE
ncbi:carbohydrate-binding family 9-like protein [Reichenbachiella carrageenanivorans]|uniref:Carbohydrate-binding family 9-like protein n=1 Tax=Reichenbachiella carrageenanivorans TaxID=2979869 RepID=A0ABY6D7E1_9BACT|nr:carbohydrate-binding family 9-like protein [Reichenbachiella carrageenanivorans]UXX80983.1 carbohydrate-binding family 9-like protein [Reichenbachiella carrageenanivorans]